MTQITIKRTGLPPLRFTGEKIGSGDTRIEHGNRANRWTEVNIYITKGCKWIAEVRSITCWQGEHDHFKASSFDTPKELIDWLSEDNDGVLGRASQEACDNAAKNSTTFAESFVELID